MPRFRLPPQILRLVLLTLVVIATYAVARHLLTPATFGQYGHYRAAALGELSAHRPRFAGAKACTDCHSDEAADLAKDKHRTLSCETCHGEARDHADNPNFDLPKPAADLCLRCHVADPARPAHQPQIVVADHYPGERCTSCHVPHQPNQSPK